MAKARSRVGELAGIKRAIDELGAEILVSYERPELLGVGEMAVRRVRVAEQAVAGGGLRPRWPGGLVTGSARFAVVGGGCDIDDVSVMGTGRGSRMLKATLAGAGVDVSEVAWLSMVPVPAKDAPTKRQVIEWRDWAMDAIEAANCHYVLLVGSTAVKAWRDDVSVEQVWLGAGLGWDTGVGVWRVKSSQRLVAATISPFSVMRDVTMTESWRRGVARWAGIVIDDRGLDALGMRCVVKKCPRDMWAYDGDGVPWCRNHWKPDGQDRTAQKYIDQTKGQGVLL